MFPSPAAVVFSVLVLSSETYAKISYCRLCVVRRGIDDLENLRRGARLVARDHCDG